MTLPLNSIYQKIGVSLAVSLPETWTSASVVYEVGPRVFDVQGRYYSDTSEKENSFIVSQETITLLEALHTQMAQTPKGSWKQARFHLRRNGEFDVKFEY